MRLVPRVLGALLLSALPCAVVSPPAVAQAAPWKFVAHTVSQVPVAGLATETINVGCQSDYVIVGGGFTTSNEPVIERVWDYKANATTYSVRIHNYSASSVTVTAYAVCALGSHVGTITTVGQDFVSNGTTGLAGGTVTCPGGQKALWGGADWNNASAPNRRLDGSAPAPNGNGWVASGQTSSPGDSLHVEAYCIATTELGGVTAPQNSAHAAPGSTWATLSICPQGQRVVSGGAMAASSGLPDPTTDVLSVGQSRPDGARSWRFGGHQGPGASFYIGLWCIPASQPSVSFTSTPPKKTTSTSNFTFTIGDQAGEAVSVECRLDGQLVAAGTCPTGSASLNALTGSHTFQVRVENTSGQIASASYEWDVDLIHPGVTAAPPTSLAQPIELTFSEAVSGVDGSSVWLELGGTSSKVPGVVKVVSPTKATWTPQQPLIAGHEYEFTFGSDIQDSFGNELASSTLLVRAPWVVAGTDHGAVHRWDVDKAKGASGGAYATSRLAGSSLTWTFRTSAGQSATVFGMRQPKGGKAAIFVDGGKVGTRSFFAASTKHGQEIFRTGPLSAGTHTLQVRALGTKDAKAKGTWVALDRLRVAGANRQELAAVHRFRRVNAAGAYDGAYASVDHATKGDNGGAPSYAVTFRSDKVVVYATLTPSSGKARILVDGELFETVNLASGSTQHQVAISTVSGLSDGVHTVRVVPVGTSSGAGSQLGIERFDATPSR